MLYKFQFGLRTNFIEKFSEFFTEPRLSLSHKLDNDFRLEFLAELKSQTTSQIIDLQNDFLGIEKRRWILSNNDNIPIIKSVQALSEDTLKEFISFKNDDRNMPDNNNKLHCSVEI